jgi:uncharacterized protein (DUF4415 family)
MAKKKKSELSVPARQVARNVRPIPDSEIDFSDIPEWTTEELEEAVEDRRRRLAGRPPSGKPWKTLISIRLEPALLKKIRAFAAKADKPYQTWIHEVLEKAVKRKRSA